MEGLDGRVQVGVGAKMVQEVLIAGLRLKMLARVELTRVLLELFLLDVLSMRVLMRLLMM